MMMTLMLAAVTHWAVPPMSDEMRLPDTEPTDGVKGGAVRIVAARDEYEPGSFVVKSDADLGKVTLALGELKSSGGAVFPKEDLDLKVVKVWYQNRNAWYSYFGDTGGFKLVPELLLNDEDLIRVDTAKEANYARLTAADGKVTEHWINPPAKMDRRPSTMTYRTFDCFFPMRPDFADAKTLQPVTLKKGEAKQFFLTAHVRKGTLPGVYRGEIRISRSGESKSKNGTSRSGESKSKNETSRSGQSKSKNGDSSLGLGLPTSTLLSIPIEIKVLDFALPPPKSYGNLDEDLWICFYNYVTVDYCRAYNGGDRELAKRQFAAIMKNKAAHGQNMHWIRFGFGAGMGQPGDLKGGGQEDFLYTVECMKNAGMITKPLVGWVCAKGTAENAALLDSLVGHHDAYLAYGDEPSVDSLVRRYRPTQREGHKFGFKYILACGPHAFAKNAHLLDWHNANQWPETDDEPRRWNALDAGKRVAWYSAQHVGVEDPAFVRRQSGICSWLSGYNAMCNYAQHLGPYNDDTTTYKPMCFFYGVHGGVLDTLAWEGFREAVDDIRYATLACKLAREAVKSAVPSVREEGLKTLAYFARFNRTDADLNEARLEITRQIVALRERLGAKDAVVEEVPTAVSQAPLVASTSIEPYRDPVDLSGIMYGRYAETEALADEAVAAAKKAGKPLGLNGSDRRWKAGNRGISPLRAARDIKWVLGKYDELGKLCDWAVTSNTNLPSDQVYELRLSSALAPLKGTPEQIADAIAKVEPALAKGVDPKDRTAVIRDCGAVANSANNENLLRGIARYLERVSPTPPKRLYTVRYTGHAVTGPDSWNALGFAPEAQTLTRDYGGGREFFVTDVTTGDRGATGKGEMKSRPTMSVVCDDWGIHFRFVDPDEKAKEIESGLVPGGSYEAYLAPGAGTPYFCFLLYPEDRTMTIMNTLYNHAGHRRLDAKDPSQVRNRTAITKNGIETYASFSWDSWGDRIPTDGFRWEFEVVRWGRAGSAAWNGLKSVHGRSTWGELAFALPPAARLAILRRQVIRAKNAYQTEKVATRGKTGVFDHWKDPELGDPAFYESCLAPLEKELDGYAAQVTADMSDDTVAMLAEKALKKWRDVVYTVAALRADYLAGKFRPPAPEPRVSVFADFIRRISKERGVSLREAADLLYDAGVRGYDCGPDETDLDELAKTRLRAINFYYFPDWFGRKTQDWNTYYSDKTKPADCLKLAKKYGIPRIMVVPPDFTDYKDNPAEFERILKEMKSFVAQAKGQGVTCTVEDYGGRGNCCSYAKYLKRLLSEIPDLRFALDSGNLYNAGRGDDILDMMAFAKDRLGHVHLKDMRGGGKVEYVTLGLGCIPNEKIVKTLHAAGYAGWYTLENPVGDTLNDTIRQAALLRSWLK